MIYLDQLSLFPLKSGQTVDRELSLKGNTLKITLRGNGELVEYARIENLSTGEVPYEWTNIEKTSVQMALDGIIEKLTPR